MSLCCRRKRFQVKPLTAETRLVFERDNRRIAQIHRLLKLPRPLRHIVVGFVGFSENECTLAWILSPLQGPIDLRFRDQDSLLLLFPQRLEVCNWRVAPFQSRTLLVAPAGLTFERFFSQSSLFCRDSKQKLSLFDLGKREIWGSNWSWPDTEPPADFLCDPQRILSITAGDLDAEWFRLPQEQPGCDYEHFYSRVQKIVCRVDRLRNVRSFVPVPEDVTKLAMLGTNTLAIFAEQSYEIVCWEGLRPSGIHRLQFENPVEVIAKIPEATSFLVLTMGFQTPSLFVFFNPLGREQLELVLEGPILQAQCIGLKHVLVCRGKELEWGLLTLDAQDPEFIALLEEPPAFDVDDRYASFGDLTAALSLATNDIVVVQNERPPSGL